jgi:hypothetical protein
MPGVCLGIKGNFGNKIKEVNKKFPGLIQAFAQDLFQFSRGSFEVGGLCHVKYLHDF